MGAEMSTFEYLLRVRAEKGAGYLVLLDPDRLSQDAVMDGARMCQSEGADAVLVGGSLLLSSRFDEIVRQLKACLDIPLIIFPGSADQISSHADALLFLCLVSGRNPELLIGQQVKAAPLLKAYGLEPISTAYLLVESGRMTTAEYISNTRPIPRDKADIAMAHALAAEYMGMKMVYLDAGSGATRPVPNEMVAAVAGYISLPIIVGGGIRTPEEARRTVESGASFIVTGTILEEQANRGLAREFADAVHTGRP